MSCKKQRYQFGCSRFQADSGARDTTSVDSQKNPCFHVKLTLMIGYWHKLLALYQILHFCEIKFHIVWRKYERENDHLEVIGAEF